MSNLTETEYLLEVENLLVEFAGPSQGIFGKKGEPVRAVDDVTFQIKKGEALGLVGESGSGKTTLGRAILRLQEPNSGHVRMVEEGDVKDILKLDQKELRQCWQNMQMIFQDPYASLNPRMTVLDIISEPLIVNGLVKNEAEAKEVAVKIAGSCGLVPDQLSRFPHAFSGGQRQRIAIARALVMQPRFIVCDEPVSALDVSIQAQILNLLIDQQKEMDLTFLFISHDLTVVAYLCNRIAVMYLGNIVEIAPTKDLFAQPLHPYTEVLMSAIPSDDPDQELNIALLKGELVGSGRNLSGCPFAPRCNYSDGKKCVNEKPKLVDIDGQRQVACHFSDTLSLATVEGI